MKARYFPILLLAGASASSAATVAYFSDSGVGDFSITNAEQWGGTNRTNNSFAFDVTIDYTSTVASEANPIILWETGGSGTGSALILDNGKLHYFAGNNSTDVITVNHGLTGSLTDIQIVTVVEMGAGAGGDELLSVYVDGGFIDSKSVDSGNDWSGGETGSALGTTSGTQRYTGTDLFNTANVVNYPETNITFNAYWLASDGGPTDNTLGNIVVPEPSTAILSLVGGLLLLLRRR